MKQKVSVNCNKIIQTYTLNENERINERENPLKIYRKEEGEYSNN